jgi:glutaredoxin 3
MFAGSRALRHIVRNSSQSGSNAMPQVEIYTTMWCPYCARARALLQKKGVAFTEFDIMDEPGRRSEMIKRAGGRTTVPQIFIGGEHIGGCDDMVALDRAGKLDPKLGIGA